MTAHELLLRLDAEATGGPWVMDKGAFTVSTAKRDPHGIGLDANMNIFDIRGWGHLTGGERMPDDKAEAIQRANGHLATTTRNLLPLLARLVGAAERVVSSRCPGSPPPAGVMVLCDDMAELHGALAALNAAAAKEAK